MNKTKVLITDTAPLYPPLWGGPRRIWNLYANFDQELYDFTYVGVHFNIGKNGCPRYQFHKIRDNFRELLVGFPPHYYPWHFIEQKLFKNTSLDLFVYLGMETDRQFKNALALQHYDILICSHPWSSLCLRKEEGQKFIYDAHNCEYLLMERILGQHRLKKYVLPLVKRIEDDACRKSDLILACSENEKNDFMGLYDVDPDKIVVITNGAYARREIKLEEKEQAKKIFAIPPEEKTIVFVGAYYKPNNDAMKFIVEKMAPSMKNYKFLLAGTACNIFNGLKIPSNVRLMGFTSDDQLDLAFKASDVAINPMFDGSGINIKMLDYMSYGLPVVTTRCGARGIEPTGASPMYISEPEDFASKVSELTSNPELFQQMSAIGRNLIAERYDWKAISVRLQQAVAAL